MGLLDVDATTKKLLCVRRLRAQQREDAITLHLQMSKVGKGESLIAGGRFEIGSRAVQLDSERAELIRERLLLMVSRDELGKQVGFRRLVPRGGTKGSTT